VCLQVRQKEREGEKPASENILIMKTCESYMFYAILFFLLWDSFNMRVELLFVK